MSGCTSLNVFELEICAKTNFKVHAKEVNKFHLAYAQVLKVNMDNLKKRERKTAETKFKSTHKAKKEY